MTRAHVKGFKIFKDRHGKQRCYHRKTGIAIDLSKAPIGSVEWFSECSRLADMVKMTAAKPGTLGGVIKEYRASDAFQTDIGRRTRADYQRIFDYLQPIGDAPLAIIDAPFLVRLRDKTATKRGRRFANYVRAVLSLLFTWCAERGYMKSNPAKLIKGVRRPKNALRANRPWADEERFVVLAEAPSQLKPPIGVAMFTGLRMGDVVALSKSAYDGQALERRTAKTNELVWWPVPSALRTILAEAPRHDAITLLANSHGKPWTTGGLSASVRKFILKLKRDGKVGAGLTFHGLRHTVATILAEEGFDNQTIADALGQRTPAMAAHYSRRANLMTKMTGVVHKLDASENRRRTKSVKPS